MIYPLCNFLLWNIKWVKGTSKSMARTCPYAFQHSYWLVLEKKNIEDVLYNERKLHVPEEGSGVKCILAF